MAPVHKVATVQFEPTMFEKERNVSRLLALCEEAAGCGAKLIVTPEMGTTGYCWFDREEVATEVEPVPGPTTRRFEALCRDHGCHIVIGMPEVDADGVYFNSAVLIGPEGVVGVHRKSHPYIAEPKWAAAGDVGHQVFETPIGRIALPERCANLCFGGLKRNRLFMAASQSIYALYVNTQGALGG